MSFARQKPAGYAFGERLPSAHANGWDLNLSRAVDGHGGGTNTLTAELTITSDAPATKGVTFPCRVIFSESVEFEDATFDGDVSFADNVTIGSTLGDTLTVNATTGFVNPVTFTAAAVFNGNVTLGNAGADTITVTGTPTFAATATFNGNLVTTADTTLGNASGDALTINATTAVQNGITFNGAVSFTGSASIATPVNSSASGHVRRRIVFGSGTTGSNYGVNTADVVYVDGATLAGNIGYNLIATDAGSGSTIRFINHDTVNAITITPSAGAAVTIRNAAGVAHWVEYTYSGTTWYVTGIYVV